MSPVCRFPLQLLSQEPRVDAAHSERGGLPPFDVQNLGGIWVYNPPLIISGLHSLRYPLQKPNPSP